MPLDTPVVIQVFSNSGNLVTIAQCDYNSLDSEEPKIKAVCAKKGFTYRVIVPHTPFSLVKFLETHNA